MLSLATAAAADDLKGAREKNSHVYIIYNIYYNDTLWW